MIDSTIGQTITVGDKGKAIVVNAGGFDLTGSALTLLAAPGNAPNVIGTGLTLRPLSIAPNGLTAVYITTGEDFLTDGLWQLQLQVHTPDGKIMTSPTAELYVNPLL